MVSEDGALSYIAGGDESPMLEMATDDPSGADISATISDISLSKDRSFTISTDMTSKEITLAEDEPGSDQFSLAVTKVEEDGTVRTFEGNAVTGGDGQVGFDLNTMSVIYKLAYTKFEDGRHNLYVADTTGKNSQFVIGRAAGPSWSADGTSIFFYGEEGVDRQFIGGVEVPLFDVTNGIVAINASPLPTAVDQAQLFQALTWKQGTARWANVSPDGNIVAYDAKPSGDFRIYFIDRATTQQLPAEIIGQQADWSPDSQRIVYRSGRDGKAGLWISNQNDSGHINITTNGTDSFPAWSPDGQTIAFSREVEGNWDIYTVNVDGSNLQRLTDAPNQDILPTYTPSGDIIFRSARNNSWEIWRMRGNGDDQLRIIANAGIGSDWAFSRMDVQ
jgi:Tol biopolymer transport system component